MAIRTEEADLDSLKVDVPAGYKLVSVTHYPDGKNPFTGKQMAYEYAVQIVLEAALAGEPNLDALIRGTGFDLASAVRDAAEHIT